TVGISKVYAGSGVQQSFTLASGCTIDLGASPTSSAELTNNGTLTIPSGTWTFNTGSITNNGTITHNGTGWDVNNANLTNNTGATITYAGTSLTLERNLTQSGTFDTTGKTLTFDGTAYEADHTILTCAGTLGGTVVISKVYAGFSTEQDFTLSSGCAIALGANSTSTGDIINNGTLTVPSGSWTQNSGSLTNNGTLTHNGSGWTVNTPLTNNATGTITLAGGTLTVTGTLTNSGTITHNGTGWDINNGNLTNNAGATITYAGTTLNVERNFTQEGTFDLTGKTLVLDGADDADDSVLTCCADGIFPGSLTINKTHASGNTTLPASPFTILGSLTRTDGPVLPASVYALTVHGNCSLSTTDALPPTLTLALAGTANQTLASVPSLAAVAVSKGAGTVTLGSNVTVTRNVLIAADGTVTVLGNVSITAGSTLDVSASNYGLTVGGNWANSGTFVPRSGTVTLNGSDTQALTGTNTFYTSVTRPKPSRPPRPSTTSRRRTPTPHSSSQPASSRPSRTA
ncbi:MAG: hypothetical protein HYW10_05195, partial [Candidatus Omnitrophica bacterium]|nr:hypothetical protein [Candidatus Omnitrophota bacterium]